jgi:hypothetical protein
MIFSRTIQHSHLLRFQSLQKRWKRSLSCLIVATGGVATTRTSSCAALSTTRSEDCPLCQKYGQGPCGDLFYVWLDCTDAASPGDDRVTRCAPHFERFQNCLEREEDYYSTGSTTAREEKEEDSKQVHPPDATEHKEDLRDGWQELIREDLEGVERQDFPRSLEPRIVTSDNNVWCVSFFSDRLVLVYVYLGGKLVTAASIEDLILGEEEWLTLLVPEPSKGDILTISAVYDLAAGESLEGNAETQIVVYERKVNASGLLEVQ